MSKKAGPLAAMRRQPSRAESAHRTRKNMDMDAKKLAKVRRVLGARTDTEAVDQALDLVLFQHEVSSALDRLAEAGGIEDVFGELGAASIAKPRRRHRRVEPR